MNNVRVPDEWPKNKKIKALAIILVFITVFLLFNI
jgi:hypothetical protein